MTPRARRPLYEAYYAWRFSDPIWRGVLNRSARRAYARAPPRLGPAQERAVADLRSSGIAVLRFSDFFPSVRVEDALDLAERELKAPAAEEAIQNLGKTDGPGGKKYLAKLWKGRPLDPSNPLVRMCLSDEVLGVTAAYLGMLPRLRYMDVWYNGAVPGTAILSQNWHRDPEDRRLVKLFLYLRDVGPENGPFCYIPGSHEAGPDGDAFPAVPPYGSHPDPAAVDARFGPSRQRVCTGPAGTLVLCDTTGLHKGGYVRAGSRLLFNAIYTTDGALPMARKDRNFGPPPPGITLGPAARYAVSGAASRKRS